jgi:hypothetical protein
VFAIVVIVFYQSIFYLENNIFFNFLKFIFDIKILKKFKNIKKLILNKKI